MMPDRLLLTVILPSSPARKRRRLISPMNRLFTGRQRNGTIRHRRLRTSTTGEPMRWAARFFWIGSIVLNIAALIRGLDFELLLYGVLCSLVGDECFTRSKKG